MPFSETIDVSTLGDKRTWTNVISPREYNALMFIDLMKQARSWTLVGATAMPQQTAILNGYVSPQGLIATDPQDGSSFRCYFFIRDDADPLMAYASGRYRMWHEGSAATVSWGGSVSNVTQVDTHTYEFDLDATQATLASFTLDGASINFADVPRNFKMVKVSYLTDYANGAIFDPDYLASLDHISGVRDLNLAETNANKLVDWADRPKMTDQFWYSYDAAPEEYMGWDTSHYAKGLPFEVLLMLAHELKVSLWACIPPMVSDGYALNLATLIRDYMNANDVKLPVVIEYSNETWNNLFFAYHYLRTTAERLWGPAGWQLGDAYTLLDLAGLDVVSKRSSELHTIMDPILGAKARWVAPMHSASGYTANERVLIGPLWLENDPVNYKRFADVADYGAITTYFGGPTFQTYPQEISDALDISLADGAAAIGVYADLVAEDTKTNLTSAAELCNDYGIKLCAYEGNTHVLASLAASTVLAPEGIIRADLYEACALYYKSQAVADTYEDVLDHFASVGGTIHCAFLAVAYNDTKGFGFSETVKQFDSTRRVMLVAWDAANPRNFLV